ncbi:MAG: threonine synthase [Proteobacteria bacterium]|nr:threonine synthase [Pseudomonadota bacterium]
MKYRSTRGGIESVSFKEAVMMGLASDGGLLVPETIPNVQPKLDQWAGLDYPALAAQVMLPFVGDINESVFTELVHRSYQSFDHPQVAPLVPVGDIKVLELFHGPTLAFKDIALQFLGEVFSHILAERNETLNILGATSGDTGSAAIAGVRGKPGIRIFVMFPEGRTSPIQERQMTTVLDDNVFNLSIDGSFDDCQNLLKSVFNDLPFKQELALGAVNSVNWARVLAQVVYYFWTWYQLGQPKRFDVSVPTGNFGNIFAGFVAKRMGLPLNRLVLATNENDILARFFDSGVYQRGAVHFTQSPAMDIQVASNFERYLFYQFSEDAKATAEFMQGFQANAEAKLKNPTGYFDWFVADAVSDDEALGSIADMYQHYRYLSDPHTAVGCFLANKYRDPDVPMVALATAHPAKFESAVEQALPETANTHPILSALTGLPTRKIPMLRDPEAVKGFIRQHCSS